MHRASRSIATMAVAALAVSGVAVVGSSQRALANDDHDTAGHVYVLNNDVVGSNTITSFARSDDGSLRQLATTPIGGTGSVAAFADVTQGSLILAGGGRRLFAVDAGSDQISVVNVRDGRLTVAGVFSSGGPGPVSLSYRDGRLYVLNAANSSGRVANVTGFRVDRAGVLHSIPGSSRPLSSGHPNPAQVQIDPTGRFLVVTEKGTNLIDIYRIEHDGSLIGPTSVPSVGDYPFGMAFNPSAPADNRDGDDDEARATNGLIVADAFGGPGRTGAVTAYRFANGNLQLVNGPVADHGLAPCWIVVTRNGKFVYTSNADSESISGYRIDKTGAISLLNADGITARTPMHTFPLEETLSHDSRFLYVLDSRILLNPPGPVTVSGYRVRDDGSLGTSVVDETKITLPFSAFGLAAD